MGTNAGAGESDIPWAQPCDPGTDVSQVETPAYVIDLDKLRANLQVLDRVQREAGCKILVALKGTVLMYQGEELGLPETDLDRQYIKDPVGDLYFPWVKGRDGCRTPMPWEAKAEGVGFTSGTSWLPVPDYHKVRAADVQAGDANSVLAHAKKVVALRKAHPALKLGEIQFLDTEGKVLAFTREGEGERLLCIFNLGTETASYALPDGAGGAVLELGGASHESGAALLDPRAGLILRIFNTR